MRRSLPWLLLLAILTTPALGAPPSVTPGTSSSAFTVSFAPIDSSFPSGPGNAAFLDFGAVSAGPAGRGGGIVVRRRVAVRFDGQPGAPATIRLSVALTEEAPGCTVRLDGIPLSTLPRLIDPVHRVGTAVAHEVEVTIPTTAPPGGFLSNLHWLAESD